MGMNPEIKEKWVAALRSGEYPQTTGALRDERGYCCLGVLCKLAVGESVVRETEDEDAMVWRYGGFTGTLPDQVTRWAGLDSDNPGFDLDLEDPETDEVRTYWTLAELNDRQKWSFEEIANVIEELL